MHLKFHLAKCTTKHDIVALVESSVFEAALGSILVSCGCWEEECKEVEISFLVASSG